MEKLQKDPKVRLLINVLYYGVILALIYVGIKYALPVVMPFVLAFLIVLLPGDRPGGCRPGRNFRRGGCGCCFWWRSMWCCSD